MNIILKIFSIYFRVLSRKCLQRANIHVYTQTVFHRNQSPSTNMWEITTVNTKKTLRRRRNTSGASAISHYFQRLNFLKMKEENTMWNIHLFFNHLELVTMCIKPFLSWRNDFIVPGNEIWPFHDLWMKRLLFKNKRVYWQIRCGTPSFSWIFWCKFCFIFVIRGAIWMLTFLFMWLVSLGINWQI